MSVYALCEVCKCRRDKATPESIIECTDKTAHKNRIAWCADIRLSRQHRRLRKIFGSHLKKPHELAESQAGQWQTDYERGKLYPSERVTVQQGFSQVADEWWQRAAVVQNRFKDPKGAKYRVEMFKRLFEQRPIASITLNEIESWITKRRENKYAVGTVNRDIKPLKWIFDFAVEKQYLTSSPLTHFKEIKGANIHDRWMTESEIGVLIKAAYDLNDLDLVDFIEVGLNTGFRLGNLMRLSAKDIVGSLIEAKQTKSGNPYTVTVADDLEPTLRKLTYLHPTGPLLNTKKIGIRFRAAVKAAGLYPDKHDNERVTIHTLRHTFAVLYLERGGDIYDLSKMLGHASIAITDKIYGRYTRKRKEGQAKLISTKIERPQQQFKVI